jgi:hypothetical protein
MRPLVHMEEHIAHARWLQSLNTGRQALDGIPEAKLQRFADEARALNVSRMRAMQETKRVTLAVAFIRLQTAQALDDVAEMLIRRVQKLHHQGKEALEDYRRQHQEQTDTTLGSGPLLVRWFGSAIQVYIDVYV